MLQEDLGEKEQMDLFLLAQMLAIQPADAIYQVMENLAQSTMELQPIYTALGLYIYDPICILASELISLNGLDLPKVFHNVVVQESLWGIIVILTFKGNFLKLKDLARKIHSGALPFLYEVVTLIAYLMLEYGLTQYHDWALKNILYPINDQTMAFYSVLRK
ncbi:hypothetical protein BJ085DRAFT_29225 [Dimargaris cristalligena]|uniref:Uncharacterized protein n=1 Tax=Dimargaris cristalligena TaxID=215637 RepID=A0A4P9ZJH3_9FUNG|nr:hypothetical protein BJ085DRAFT_29225 [Dimargaris cristalligena]|eukprot:RKP33215.1 hypothetical protein BJ085DRAFT_29225 [Dimargaris cristalligena]